ncbi:Predicted arabinose efflux permease, MFS family [Lentzea waywayandensis]|uniref:Predicted arabinose efflux permease, MFS family n=1 Tax=Lentzea waywayandensis TaxID=84724 RepID=A0A1I6D452_9PSEU|nr:MFS transporter [Lentzea waywayandensis]SFR00143.1 Predicted arabinose efflux permease, MFS family [Lentzea waywayandensis]
MTAGRTERISFCAVLRVGEFRAMWLAEMLSFTGDQFARVALVVLVFDRTNSAAFAGLTYALTFIPVAAGALALSHIADRRSRREVIVVADGLRALVVGVMAVPGIDLGWLCVLAAVMSFIGGPYGAAQLALLRDLLTADQYPMGMTVRQVTVQAAQLVGFVAGGVLSAALSPQSCLAINAVTFAVSALIIRTGVRSRPAAAPVSSSGRLVAGGIGLVWRDPRRRAIFMMTFLGVFYVVPEGIAAPFVHELGHGAGVVGVVLASCGVGAMIGLPLFFRFVTPDRQRGALAVVCLSAGLPLVLVPLGAGIYGAMLLFAVSGALWAALVVMSVSFLSQLLPDDRRAQGMGVASSANITAQGLGAGLAGVLAEVVSPSWVIAVAGALSVPAALWPCLLWLRSTSRSTEGVRLTESTLS